MTILFIEFKDLQAAVRRGDRISCIRDFYSMYIYITPGHLHPDWSAAAMRKTFTLFGNDLPVEFYDVPASSDASVDSHPAKWEKFIRETKLHVPVPVDIADVVDAICEHLDPILIAANTRNYGAVG